MDFSLRSKWQKQAKSKVCLSYWGVSRSIHEFKVQIYIKVWIFHLKFKVYLKFLWIFRFLSKAQNDNALPFLQVDFFATAAPCKPLGCFLSKAQNDKIGFFFDYVCKLLGCFLKTASNGNLRFLQKLKQQRVQALADPAK